MSDAAAWYGWLRQRMECPQPWPMAPHASAALPAPPPPRPLLGAGCERSLPPRSARCCHRARCSAPRRAGGEDGAGATLIDGAAAAPRGWAGAAPLGGGPGGAGGAAPAARRRPTRAAPGLARAPRRAGERPPLSRSARGTCPPRSPLRPCWERKPRVPCAVTAPVAPAAPLGSSVPTCPCPRGTEQHWSHRFLSQGQRAALGNIWTTGRLQCISSLVREMASSFSREVWIWYSGQFLPQYCCQTLQAP